MKFIDSIKFKKNISFEVLRNNQSIFPKTKHKELNQRKSYSREIGKAEVFKPVYDEWEEFIIFNKGFSLEFKDVTIISGDNGYGKTTLIKYLKSPNFEEAARFNFISGKTKEEIINETWKEYVNGSDCKLKFKNKPDFIYYSDNHSKGGILQQFKKSVSNGMGEIDKMENFVSLWDAQNFSNGETNLDALSVISQLQNGVIILDEPETSLSLRSQFKTKEMLKEVSKTNQLIIITHSPILMEITDDVYNFETKEYVKRMDFFNSQKI